MTETRLDMFLELLAMLATGIGSVVLTGLALLAEQAGLQNLALGNIPLGVWETGMGLALLFFGVYLLGYNQFLSRAHRLLTA